MNSINKYLKSQSGLLKESTQTRYQDYLELFFKVIKKDSKTYFDSKQEYQEDILKYLDYLQKNNSHSVMNKIYTIQAFIRYYLRKQENTSQDIYGLQELVKKIGKRQSKRPVMKDVIPERETLKKILEFAKPNAKALFMIAITSGMRISEILQLTPDNIDLSYKPCKIEIYASMSKTNEPRTTFITDETKHALETWLTEKNYLKTKYKKYQRTNKIFPFTYHNANDIWKRLITKAKCTRKNPITKRYTMHIHLLRKYFRTQISTKIPSDVSETLIGHENPMLPTYVTYSDKELAEHYKDAIPNLLIFEEETTDLTDINKQIKKLQEENKRLNNHIKDLIKTVYAPHIFKEKHNGK